MVDINFTLLVELGLFLVFLWGTHALIIKRVVRHTDARDQALEEDERATHADLDEAKQLETRFTSSVAGARRSASAGLEQARHHALAGRTQLLDERKRKADAVVTQLRTELEGVVEKARNEHAALAPSLAGDIVRRLDVDGAQR
jgi:F0F1-type ATP synthase membrane subunit b/b'